MSTGSLLYPPGYTFLDDNGVPLNAGLLYSYRTGTSTAQDLYSDSGLSTALSNPVVLNSAGRATTNGSTLTAIYGASDTGFDYRITLKTSAGVQVWQLDDLVVDGADTVTLAEGSFTATLATGYAVAPTGTVNYRVFANSAGTGKTCHLWTTAAITGTSNATALTLTGVPAACQTTGTTYTSMFVALDNDVAVQAIAHINVGTMTFFTDDPLAATGWTAGGGKGLHAGWSTVYPIR